MIYQFLWTETVLPLFDDETKLAYTEMANQHKPWAQIYPIGNVVDGRRMFHGLGPIELCQDVIDFLIEKECYPKVITIKDKDGIDYGYKKVFAGLDEDENNIYEIIRDESIVELFEINQDDHTIYLQPHTEVIDGDEVIIQPTLNCFYGWEQII